MTDCKTGLLCETFNQFAPIEEKIWKIGENTGNILFFAALHEILDCAIVRGWEHEKLSQLDRIVTTELIWIQEGARPSENANYWLENLNSALVPISVGLQTHEFKPDFDLAPQMVRLLSAIQERATICVRGEYTASILIKHGVHNLAVVGCPSVYQLPLFQDSLDFLFEPRRKNLTTCNFKTFLPSMSPEDRSLLQFLAANADGFAEQTLFSLSDTELKDESFADWFTSHSYLFFDLESWVRYNLRFDFSLGLRFHGNVAAILAGARALFITMDSRTKEMTDHFGLPALGIEQFDTTKPLEYYYEAADFTKFKQTYQQRLSEFIAVIKKNNIGVRKSYQDCVNDFKY